MQESSSDKQWAQAQAYILDPLTAPEPSQETGIASSHNLAANFKRISLSENKSRSSMHSAGKKTPKHHSLQSRDLLTPPSSASPSRSSFHPSNPFFSASEAASEASSVISPPRSPARSPRGAPRNSRRYPPSASVNRSASARVSHLAPDYSDPRHHRSRSTGNCDLARKGSINQRFPGDMSHRPLDVLRKEARAADRSPHLRRKYLPHTDTIDALDTIGGTYHHGGPYDATLASRNRNKLYSPVAAVEESTMEAIRATPREYLEDSMRKKVPLQGTAIIPSGAEDFRGNKMKYEEGADLMREPDAGGGAYKRWEDITYHPDDLKGKGPNFELERDLKEKKRLAKGQPNEYELVSQSSRPLSFHRGLDDNDPAPVGATSTTTAISRHSSTSKRFSEGFKRRIGSIRRKKMQAV